MKTIVKKVDPDNIDMDIIRQASDIIKNGGLVVFPTETVYGLGGDGMLPSASKKIYEAKGRPSDNPLIIHISSISELENYVKDIPCNAKILMDNFWPGPMTLIFNKKEEVPYETTGGLETVAIRMPSHPIANALIKESKTGIAAPSANLSGRPSPTKASHCIEDLSGRVDMIIDGDKGHIIGLESTIIDVTGDVPMILRPGYITKAMINEAIGEVLIDKVVLTKEKSQLLKGDYKPKAPGMKYRHYAPKAEFVMFEGEEKRVIEVINQRAKEAKFQGKKVGIIATKESFSQYENANVISIGSRKNDESIAASLFDVLRKFDELEVDIIFGETFFDEGLGMAIMNRLIKAAGYNIEKVD
ncbi:L-threonylcarbamoyladenylate synthase [Acetitomaculum ruminis DSM 5522]|uniref:Threonylcarbamoyl-AMP synthase n=1 Tax=Acetitomaculum ruminis DSM 5522 TaxID=1120918 RepID=A0A1I0W185_9FIRM|nr:L-threonylcarbamoyladenylate synthase [Acetitomaculum ruminis]SFA82505.1 L-threonylcarbamoyladenylate synthase [Acetitomaculum ruminis DSM 5522]